MYCLPVVEPLLARHGDLDEVEPVGAQIFGQSGVVGEPRFLGAEVEDEDIPDFCRYVGHRALRGRAGEGPRVTSYALRDRHSVRNVTQAKGRSKPPHLTPASST